MEGTVTTQTWKDRAETAYSSFYRVEMMRVINSTQPNAFLHSGTFSILITIQICGAQSIQEAEIKEGERKEDTYHSCVQRSGGWP